jgi:hypothetical protein
MSSDIALEHVWDERSLRSPKCRQYNVLEGSQFVFALRGGAQIKHLSIPPKNPGAAGMM